MGWIFISQWHHCPGADIPALLGRACLWRRRENLLPAGIQAPRGRTQSWARPRGSFFPNGTDWPPHITWGGGSERAQARPGITQVKSPHTEGVGQGLCSPSTSGSPRCAWATGVAGWPSLHSGLVRIASGSVEIGAGTRLGLNRLRDACQCIWQGRVGWGALGIEAEEGGRTDDREPQPRPNALGALTEWALKVSKLQTCL